MTVWPYAPAASRFSAGVDYVFRVRRVQSPNPLTLDATALDVTCNFDDATPQNVTCVGPGRLRASARVGDEGGSGGAGGIRVFAGPRSDPAYFDRQGALATVAGGRAELRGQNAFAGANVLAIVVELDARAAFEPVVDGGMAVVDGGMAVVDGGAPGVDGGVDGGAPLPMLAVAAETIRRGR
jgi:hypothetical protein